MQDLYLECLKRLEHREAIDRDTFFVWLRMVTLQTLTDLHRKHLQAKSRDANRDRSLQAPAGPDTSACLSSALADGWSSPSHHTAQAELVLLVQAALQELSPNDQEIIALRHHEELTNQEVAQVLGEKMHKMEAVNSTAGENWRDASKGGYFMYEMKVRKEMEQSVCLQLLGSDSGNRIFDVLIDGKWIDTIDLSKPL